MTPEMERLCQAAEEAFETVFHGDAEITPGGAETIVRAILMRLRQTSESMRKTGAGAVADHFALGQAPEEAEGIARDVIVGVIDQVLA
ncbi:hypothetical protein [Methylobacterium sp. J-070]|uniref:hypothetical protein n=1 Tax=Methylobacterium sp. J-070 TaxID=2836650 RepID=UPI001FB99AD7|nr:hypothetical protein [Methylobacterium sp. J-070]MCJ2052332.1 hypothetical protein [Methylobacterium sp. J-070]